MPYSNGIMQFSVWNTIQTWAGDIVCSRSGLCVLVLAIILVVYCLFRLLTRTVKILLVRLIGGCIKHATTNREALFTATQSGIRFASSNVQVLAARCSAQESDLSASGKYGVLLSATEKAHGTFKEALQS